jgi:hypothetical protein
VPASAAEAAVLYFIHALTLAYHNGFVIALSQTIAEPTVTGADEKTASLNVICHLQEVVTESINFVIYHSR